MPESTAVAPKKKFLSGLLGGGKSYWIFALVFALVAVMGVLQILGSAATTVTYYVLKDPVPARTQITTDMLFPVEASQGGQPPNALDIADIQEMNNDEGAFSLIPLDRGDVVTASTVGPLERITTELPAGYVAASFALDAESAVAGKVRTGDYIDITAIDDSDPQALVAKTVLHRVLVLDVVTNPKTIATAATGGQEGANLDPGPESSAVRGGIPSLYVVGLSEQDATTLALVRGKNLMISLSANDAEGRPVDAISNLPGVMAPGPVGDASTGPEAAVEPEAADSATDPEN